MAQREKPNAIILDIGLPGGDGFIVMDRLRKLNINAPIIILTARDPLINRERALKAGAKFFFQKPVENGKLLGALSEV
jgi:DNA-binding response OmpR family regulator